MPLKRGSRETKEERNTEWKCKTCGMEGKSIKAADKHYAASMATHEIERK